MDEKIVVIGSSNVDFIMKMERLPHIGETITNAQFMQTFGGKGANQAAGAARAGGDVWFVNCVGDDIFASLLMENMRQLGVHTEYVLEQTGINSGTALVMVGSAGENYLSVSPGANYLLTPQMVDALEPLIAEARMVVLQYEILPETLYAAIDLASRLGKPIMFNLAPARAFDPARLPQITYLVVNEVEAESLCGFSVKSAQAVERAADHLLASGAHAVIITLGADGAYLACGEQREKLPAFEVEAVDTTGAGDIFCGALAVALVEGRDLPTAARFASAAAAISVTRLGAQPSAPSRAEIDQWLDAKAAAAP